MAKPAALSERVELTYLATLRIVVLIVATICVLLAAYLFLDGGRRLTTSTSVTPEPVRIAPADVLQGVATQKEAAAAGAPTSPASDDPAKQKFDAFKNGAFTSYHQIYAGLAQRYRKPEDPILSVDQLAQALGYTLDAYKGGDDETVRLFVDNPDYAAQLSTAAVELTKDTRIVGQLGQYRMAEKTSQACGTEYEARRMWDPTSTACADWYRYPMGCPVIRSVPVERCHPAYPAGITSPAEAFAQMDRGFRAIWAERAAKSNAAAAAEHQKREATKASGVPTLVQSVQVFMGFLVVMFLFLVVAMERHLRRLSKMSLQTPEPEARPSLRAAE